MKGANQASTQRHPECGSPSALAVWCVEQRRSQRGGGDRLPVRHARRHTSVAAVSSPRLIRLVMSLRSHCRDVCHFSRNARSLFFFLTEVIKSVYCHAPPQRAHGQDFANTAEVRKSPNKARLCVNWLRRFRGVKVVFRTVTA